MEARLIEETFIEFIHTLDALFKQMQEEAGSASGVSQLTISQFQYIDAIHRLGTPTITEIAESLAITKASVTAGINKLLQQGYVTKTQSPTDKRVFRVSLTPASQCLIEVKYRAIREYGAFINEALSEEEVRQFHAIITKLVARCRQSPI